ncbi:MAG TPA: hypothetical protein VNO24_26915 [Blastocatellia bacterium]|nr:hypothetical protein [Blastocatellia bacterium]
MKTFRQSLILIAVCSLLMGSAPMTANSALALASARKNLSAATEQELAQARRATAKYHDVAQAEADGYVNFDLYVTGEGYHYIKLSLLDANFDPEQPEMLLYSPVPGEDRLELAGVEYLVPIALSPTAPAGFTGDDDQWRNDAEGFGLWELNAWIWLHNPEGMFAHDNPRVP